MGFVVLAAFGYLVLGLYVGVLTLASWMEDEFDVVD